MNAPNDRTSTTVTDFNAVHQDERARLELDPNLRQLDGVGLAFSGGGIRSASFALGVVQVLLNEDLFPKVDYLSTVSGGGYLGSALSWWLHQAATDTALAQQPDGLTRFLAFRQQFGSKVIGARTTQGKSLWSNASWLSYIRQHGNYLQPRGVGYASLAASILRVCLYPLCVYGLALFGVFCLDISLETSEHAFWGLEHLAFLFSGIATLLLVLLSWLYGPATWIASLLGDGVSRWLYRQRTRYRSYSGLLLSLIVAGLVIFSVPAIAGWLESWVPTVSLSFLSLGSIGTVYQFVKGRAQSKSPSWLGSIRLVITAALVIYGLLLGTYVAAALVPVGEKSMYGLIALVIAVVFGGLINSNYAGLARLYRDRLMEAFLPNLAGVAANNWSLATQADAQTVESLKGRLDRQGNLAPVQKSNCQRPFHLINCNAVLMDSPKDLYRNRGGDNFFISARWSGSNATGWLRTNRLGDGAMSLATAMSISGAAANPNAAPNGLGVTRNRLVSFLMSLFDVRLGYWMANPKKVRKHPSNRPNLWVPGLRQGLLGSGLNENARFIELTDGGHFDNTALYELIRRRTRIILVAQAGCDPKFTMEDMANLIEKVRVDFSVFIEFGDPGFSLDALRVLGTDPYKPCDRGFAIARIRYPVGTPLDPQYEDGYLVYMQAVPTRSAPADIVSYWRRHGEFPNDSTTDQFFTEENLEAYRELGYAIASEFYRELKIVSTATPIRGDAMTALRTCLLPAVAPPVTVV